MKRENHAMRLSVIVPVYNVSQYLDECLASIMRQKMRDMEVWLIDDGSTDDSALICNRYVEIDERFHVIHQRNQGVSAARNTGILKSSGEWILFIDGDDLLVDELTDHLYFANYDKADIVFFGYINQRENGTRFLGKLNSHSGLFSKEVNLALPHVALCSSLQNRISGWPGDISVCSPWGKIYRRSFLLDNNMFFTPGLPRGQDALFNFQIYLMSPKGYLESFMGYIYRKNPLSITHRYNCLITKYYQLLGKEYERTIVDIKDHTLRNELNILEIEFFLFCCQIDFAHKDNPYSYCERKKKFRQARDSMPFSRAFKKYDRKQFVLLGRKGRIAVWLCEKKLFFLYERYLNAYCLLERLVAKIKPWAAIVNKVRLLSYDKLRLER